MFEWYKEEEVCCESDEYHFGVKVTYKWNNLEGGLCPLCSAKLKILELEKWYDRFVDSNLKRSTQKLLEECKKQKT
jgi:transcription initiation factor IIE alpha subunit